VDELLTYAIMLDSLIVVYHTICDNTGRITESAKSGTEVNVEQGYHSPIRMNYTKNYGCESITFLLH
jgi:hypothetical protein